MTVNTEFRPTRLAALDALNRFAPHAGAHYSRLRNFDFGPGSHKHVSGLSPYLRHRLLTEEEVLKTVLSRHSVIKAEKFIQEVFWRSYWKGWLEQRPAVWADYQDELAANLNRLHVESGLNRRWSDACAGQTGIDGFDQWAQELTTTGYLHNHARMWFASIWIFTLRLPWQLGADFFLRHLLDGDPASNTLSWRWVAGLQTIGKPYLARPENIARYTEGRFSPEGLAITAVPLPSTPPPPRQPLPVGAAIPEGRLGLLMHEDDLSPGFLFHGAFAPSTTATLLTAEARSPMIVAPMVTEFARGALDDTLTRWSDRLGPQLAPTADIAAIAGWAAAAHLEAIVTPYAPIGPGAKALDQLEKQLPIPVVRVMRPYDQRAWPYATAGFFKFKEAIPALLDAL